MTRSLKADQDTSRHIVTQHPIPDRWSTSLVISLREDVFRIMKAIRLRDSNWQPNDVEKEVENNESCGQAEDCFVGLRIQVVHADPYEENAFRDNPLNRTKLDTVDARREVNVEYCKLGEQKVGTGLGVRSDEGSPCCRAPPCNDKSEESPETLSASFGRPKVN